jgi:hypothetical protein
MTPIIHFLQPEISHNCRALQSNCYLKTIISHFRPFCVINFWEKLNKNKNHLNVKGSLPGGWGKEYLSDLGGDFSACKVSQN